MERPDSLPLQADLDSRLSDEPPLMMEALARANRYAALAETDTDAGQKAYYDRMSRKWRAIAEDYRRSFW